MTRTLLPPDGPELVERVDVPAAAPVAASPPPAAPGWQVGAGLLSASIVLISAGNYLYSLVAVRTLEPGEFSTYSAAQALLLVLGTGCMAAIPWAMARSMALADTARTRREALHFGLVASLVQGLVAAPVAGAVLWLVAGPGVAAVTAAGALTLSLVAAPVGFLQGEERVGTIAGLRLVEWVLRVGAGLAALALVARTGAMALVGFPIGSGVLFLLALRASRAGFPLQRGDAAAVRGLLRQALALGAVQVAISALGAIDALAAEGSGFSDAASGSYQVAAMLGRIPLFVSTAVALAVYTVIARAADDRGVARHLREATGLYAAVAVPTVVACWTVPQSVVSLVVPDAYTQVVELLRFTSIAGAAVGLANVVSTAHQARGRFRAGLRVLVPFAVLEPFVLVAAGRLGGVDAFAWVLVAVTVAVAVLLLVDARRWSPVRLPRPSPAWVPGGAVVVVAALTGSAAVWSLAVAALFALAAVGARRLLRELHEEGSA